MKEQQGYTKIWTRQLIVKMQNRQTTVGKIPL